jgi:hypothetical protein
MKETKEIAIAVNELIDGGVYKTHTNDLVQIKGIYKDKNQLHVYNITESCNIFMNLKKHHLVKRIR